MLHISFLSSRAAAFVLAILSILAFAGDAQAQSAACSRLLDNLRTFDRNSDFRDVERNSRETRALENELQTAESRYIRNGCSDMVRNGEQLTRQCLSLARTITEGRAELEELRESVGTGNAVAQQREALLQEISRFGCRTDSRASIDDDDDGGRGGLFDRMFGGYTDEEQFDDGDLMLDDFAGYGGYSTVRTVCVRACDGYYWPVSYSTLTDYAYQDAQQCQAQCPGTPVDLYYYSNPGQNPEQMVSLSGEPYTALPNAFRYRETFDPSCSCKAPVNLGNISIVSQSGGQSRAVIDFSGATFPLPLRDPRGQPGPTPAVAEPVTVAEVINVPLPRRRPTAPGETPAEQPVPVEDGSDQMRLVQFGDRTVRIVGPDTPYGQPAAAGT